MLTLRRPEDEPLPEFLVPHGSVISVLIFGDDRLEGDRFGDDRFGEDRFGDDRFGEFRDVRPDDFLGERELELGPAPYFLLTDIQYSRAPIHIYS